MDLSSVLNTTNAAPEPKSSRNSSPVAQRSAQPPSFPPPPGANGPSPSYAQYPSHQTTPQYAPPPQEHRSPTGSVGYHGAGTGATPLQTPSHAGGHGQYPFPQHPSQSPVAAHPGQQQQQPYTASSSATPGSRPMSHGFQQQPPTPSQMGPTGVPAGFQQYSSHSPTPPSHHGHTPHSVRQSPLATFAHPPQPPAAQQYPYQQSQPSTPLGPPSVQHQRISGHGSHPEIFSPNHHRHFSGASNGIVAGSPAQHHPSVGNLIDSPSAYNRQSPQVRRTSDYSHISQGERERSLSVSPKTKIVPRLPSHGSRQSSVNEGYSQRSSFQTNGPQHQHHETQGHVQSPVAGRHPGAAQSSFAHSASDVSQMASRSSLVSHPDVPPQPAPQTPLFPSAAPPQHHSQKMGMNHLLTPARETDTSPQMQSHDHSDAMARKHSTEQMASSVQSSSRAQSPQDVKHDTGSRSLLQQPVQPVTTPNGASEPSSESRKRPASSGLASEPPMKREKKRKYVQRPIWATLSRSNPNYDGTNGLNAQNGKPPIRQQTQQQQQRPPQQQARATPQPAAMPQSHQRPNGASHTNGATAHASQDQPLDEDLMLARSILGPWEKSIKRNVPTPSVLRLVQDWFWTTLEANADIGNDPRTGTIEIEAKIGTLVRSGEQDRARFEAMNMQILNPTSNKNFRFESRMEEPEHKAMNEFLNAATQASMEPGRVPVQYEHLYQTDTFAKLSPAGLASLPRALQQRNALAGRELRLRTSRNSKTGAVLAHIIKVPLGNLHIANPLDPYDCRISINLEVNLDQPGLHPDDLIEHERAPPPERRKDRLSYKHLAYSIDLTRIDSAGVAPKYELELEVDANVLREQIARIKGGQASAYSSVVSGFLDNATFLMRQAPKEG
ncbi:hypothetical protein Q7P37_007569 [Cladosporium fusiforme]